MPPSDPKRHPWQVPLGLLGLLCVAGFGFTSVYGPLGSTEWGLSIAVTAVILFWGWIRSLQHGPAFEPARAKVSPPPQPLLDRLRWAFGYTLPAALLFSAYVLLIAGMRGSSVYFTYGTSIWGIIAIYWLAAILSGGLLGFLRPLARFRLGAFVVGAIVGSAVYGTAMLALPLAQSMPWWIPLIPGTILGGGLGLVEHDGSSAAV